MKPPQLEVAFDQPEPFTLRVEQAQDGERLVQERTQLETDRNESAQQQMKLKNLSKNEKTQ